MSEDATTTVAPPEPAAPATPAAPAAPEARKKVEYRLTVREDKMAVVLDHPDPAADLHATVDKILAGFIDLELVDAPDGPALLELLETVATAGEPLKGFTVATGTPPVPPIDAQLEWTREFFTEGWAIDPDTGTINFWERMERRSVHQGEPLLKVIHPAEGQPGANVFGVEIAPAKPAKVKVRCGKGVEMAEIEGATLYSAAIDGRVRWADNTIAVDDVYAIRGDVSLETGNIHHTGSLVIEGDVNAGATVEADGDIIVKGMIEAATILCGGSLTVAGGILGSQDTRIEVQGEVHAKYISEADVSAGGSVTAANEIAHSKIRTRGKVDVTRGRICGGETYALQGIHVAEAGASGSTRTLLVSGVDYTLTAKLEQRHQNLERLDATLEKIEQTFERAKQRRDPITPELKTKLADLMKKREVVTTAREQEKATIERVTRTALADAVEEIAIFSELWSGTTIQLGRYQPFVVKSSVQKPRIAQVRNKKIRVLPMGEGNAPEE